MPQIRCIVAAGQSFRHWPAGATVLVDVSDLIGREHILIPCEPRAPRGRERMPKQSMPNRKLAPEHGGHRAL